MKQEVFEFVGGPGKVTHRLPSMELTKNISHRKGFGESSTQSLPAGRGHAWSFPFWVFQGLFLTSCANGVSIRQGKGLRSRLLRSRTETQILEDFDQRNGFLIVRSGTQKLQTKWWILTQVTTRSMDFLLGAVGSTSVRGKRVESLGSNQG